MENYESLGVIGEGTYGVVMKARHKGTGQVVAIKKFKESDDDEQVRKTSLREVRVLKQLKHDNVINLLEAFRRKGKLYLVFEYVESTILEVLERKPNGLDEIDVKKYTYQLLKGVEYIHAHNIIHRDVKPENILIAKSGALKICDFGFARPMSVGGKYTDYVATRWYRGPELLVGDVEYGKGVDIWAIGCIFAEISNGMPLFAGESDIDQLHVLMRCNGKITNRQVQIFRRNALYVGVELPHPRDLETLDVRFPNSPRNWLNFLKACLKNDPEQRETCTGLLNLPYFTDKNFKTEYDGELKMIMEKESRTNALSRQRNEAHQAAQQQAQQQQQAQSQQQGNYLPPSTSNKGGPVDPLSGGGTGHHQGNTPDTLGALKSNTLPSTNNNNKGYGGGGGSLPSATNQAGSGGNSLWSQYLHQASDPRSSGPSGGGGGGGLELPGVTGKGSSSSNNQGGGSFLPPSHQMGGSSKYGGGSSHHGHQSNNPSTSNHSTHNSSSHHSYMTSYNNQPEPLMVTNNHSSSNKASNPYGLNAQSNLGGFSSSSKPKPLGGGTALPTLGSSGVSSTGGGGGSGSLPSMHSGGWTAPSGGLSSQPSGGGGTASQLQYKKKPGKRNVLSTLSLTAFGGQQQPGGYNPLDNSAPSGGSGLGGGGGGGTSSGMMMLHGQSHSLGDHPSGGGNPGGSHRRTSKPWM